MMNWAKIISDNLDEQLRNLDSVFLYKFVCCLCIGEKLQIQGFDM